MKTGFRRTSLSSIPGFTKNTVIQLIIVIGTSYVIFHFLEALFFLVGTGKIGFMSNIVNNVGIPSLAHFQYKLWTLITYAWFHMGFWELVSNMLWLYVFGNLVQVLVGHKQVVPLFVYSIIAGGIFYTLSQLIPGNAFAGRDVLIGCQAGLVGMAAAAVTIAPSYRFFLGPRLSFPMMLVAGIFLFLMLLDTGLHMSLVFLLLGGGLTGWGYMRLLKNGYKPGEWIYDILGKIESIFTPNEHAIWEKKGKKRKEILRNIQESKRSISQNRVDEILDKINQRGYDSLTAEEKDILFRAGKEEN